MHQHAEELPVCLEVGDIGIQAHNWGDINVARIRFPAGADATPLLEGLPDNLCQCPHWGDRGERFNIFSLCGRPHGDRLCR